MLLQAICSAPHLVSDYYRRNVHDFKTSAGECKQWELMMNRHMSVVSYCWYSDCHHISQPQLGFACAFFCVFVLRRALKGHKGPTGPFRTLSALKKMAGLSKAGSAWKGRIVQWLCLDGNSWEPFVSLSGSTCYAFCPITVLLPFHFYVCCPITIPLPFHSVPLPFKVKMKN